MCLLSLSLLSLIRYFNDSNFLLDIMSHFSFQYAVLSLVFLSFCLWKKKNSLAVLAGALFIFQVIAIVDVGRSIHAAGDFGTPFKVYSANLHISNDDLSKLNLEHLATDPDILLLLEVTPVHFEQLQSVIKTYPYRKEIRSLGKFEIGFVLLSKFPMLINSVTKLSERCNFVLEAMIDINKEPVMFYAVHAQRPGLGNHSERKNQFHWLARQIKEQSLPVIVAGDFNATPYSPIFRELVKITGLKDSREGFGWQPSWPTYFPPLWIPIDHVLVTPDIQVRKRKTGSYIGSDHYPVIVELSI